MNKEEAMNWLHDMMEAHKHTSGYKDAAMTEIYLRRREFEQRLDEMWAIYLKGNMKQLFTYKEQVKIIKAAGLEVLRSKSTGKHKIVLKKVS